MWPGGTPSYATWRQAVLDAEALGVDAIFGYDHFHKPFVEIRDGGPHLLPEQPDVNNFEAWTALASWGEITTRAEIGLLQADRDESRIERSTAWKGPAAADAFHAAGVALFTTEVKPTQGGYDLTVVKEMVAWRDGAR
jgi:hypothetical protein